MTGRLLSMTDRPPPTDPPPGWYPDPAGGPDYRWWDGLSWTDSLSTEVGTGPLSRDAPSVGVFGTWFSESFRSAIDRAGHFLPMILVFVLSVSVPTSFGIWYAVRNTVLTFDPETAAPAIDYGGSRPWLIAVAASVPLSTILSFLCKASVARQVWAVKADRPEPWSDSVREVLRRSGRVIPYSLGRAAIYYLLGGVLVAALLLSPGFILMAPFVGALLFFFWIRFAFVGTVAALGGPDDNPFAESWRLTGLQLGPLIGRLLVLAFVAFNLVLAFGIIGAPFTAIAGGGGNTVEPGADTLALNDLLGSNPSVFALGSLFNAVGLGAGYVLAAAGTTLLYRNLDGPAFDRPTETVPVIDDPLGTEAGPTASSRSTDPSTPSTPSGPVG